MSQNIIDINHKHGQNMYILGLEHAINMMDIAGDDALPLLKKKLAELKKERGDE